MSDILGDFQHWAPLWGKQVYLESPAEKKIHPMWLLWFVNYAMAHELAYLLIREHMTCVSWWVVRFGPLVTH